MQTGNRGFLAIGQPVGISARQNACLFETRLDDLRPDCHVKTGQDQGINRFAMEKRLQPSGGSSVKAPGRRQIDPIQSSHSPGRSRRIKNKGKTLAFWSFPRFMHMTKSFGGSGGSVDRGSLRRTLALQGEASGGAPITAYLQQCTERLRP